MNRYQYIPGTDPLAPFRMSEADVDDLVRRVKIADAEAAERQRCALEKRRSPHVITPYRVAARYMRMCDATADAAMLMIAEVSGLVLVRSTLRKTWCRLYPGVKRPGHGVQR